MSEEKVLINSFSNFQFSRYNKVAGLRSNDFDYLVSMALAGLLFALPLSAIAFQNQLQSHSAVSLSLIFLIFGRFGRFIISVMLPMLRRSHLKYANIGIRMTGVISALTIIFFRNSWSISLAMIAGIGFLSGVFSSGWQILARTNLTDSGSNSTGRFTAITLSGWGIGILMAGLSLTQGNKIIIVLISGLVMAQFLLMLVTMYRNHKTDVQLLRFSGLKFNSAIIKTSVLILFLGLTGGYSISLLNSNYNVAFITNLSLTAAGIQSIVFVYSFAGVFYLFIRKQEGKLHESFPALIAGRIIVITIILILLNTTNLYIAVLMAGVLSIYDAILARDNLNFISTQKQLDGLLLHCVSEVGALLGIMVSWVFVHISGPSEIQVLNMIAICVGALIAFRIGKSRQDVQNV